MTVIKLVHKLLCAKRIQILTIFINSASRLYGFKDAFGAMQWTISDGLEVVWRHAITILTLNEGDDSSALVV